VAGHLRRDPSLIRWLAPVQEMVWGLAALGLTPAGRTEISELAGLEVAAPDGYIPRHSLSQALEAVLKRDGVDAALDAVQRLMRRGFEAARRSGASISPFIGSGLAIPGAPAGDDPDEWRRYSQRLAEWIASRRDFESDDIGPQLLAVMSGARGSLSHLVNLLGSRGAVETSDDPAVVPIKRGWAQGLTSAEMLACVVPARRGLARTTEECIRAGYAVRESGQSKGFNVLARAMRSPQPGFVFAHAAAAGEIDPLTDLDSRLFVGLPAKT
jgi:hypothetical protein